MYYLNNSSDRNQIFVGFSLPVVKLGWLICNKIQRSRVFCNKQEVFYNICGLMPWDHCIQGYRVVTNTLNTDIKNICIYGALLGTQYCQIVLIINCLKVICILNKGLKVNTCTIIRIIYTA